MPDDAKPTLCRVAPGCYAGRGLKQADGEEVRQESQVGAWLLRRAWIETEVASRRTCRRDAPGCYAGRGLKPLTPAAGEPMATVLPGCYAGRGLKPPGKAVYRESAAGGARLLRRTWIETTTPARFATRLWCRPAVTPGVD